MSFDGIFTHMMTKELNELLIKGRITKVHQPYQNEMVLIVRSNRKNKRLLLSAHPQYARVHVTEMEYVNPPTPPQFCMVMRKYVEGAHIEKIEQVENDRIIHFHLSHRNELGDLDTLLLITEIMGRHSNILLVNPEDQKIIEVIRHIPSTMNTYRSLVPGATYIPPPPQDKTNPFNGDFSSFVSEEESLGVTFGEFQKKYQGLGRDTAQELELIAQNNQLNETEAVRHFKKKLESETESPTLTIKDKKEFLTPIQYESIDGEYLAFPTLSELCDRYYDTKADRDRAHQQSHDLSRLVANLLSKNQDKKKKLSSEMTATKKMDAVREKGEILTAFLYQVEAGETTVHLSNFYDEDKEIEISLDPQLSPSQNAQAYFKRYQKLKKAVIHLNKQLKKTKEEIHYLESVQTQLDLASPQDIESIREELIQEGYLQNKNKKKKKAPSKKTGPEKFRTTDGTSVLVGKNNLQNDQLSLKTAHKSDFWLHAKDIPGSHVIVRSDSPSEETLLEAAQLAAYFSKFRDSATVPVDIVQVKKLKKPNGAKPGLVIYEGQNTVFVTPDIKIIRQLKENEKKSQ